MKTLLCLILLAAVSNLGLAQSLIHHQLRLTLDPQAGSLTVDDHLSFQDAPPQAPCFRLHPALTLELPSSDITLTTDAAGDQGRYCLSRLPDGPLHLRYHGPIHQPELPVTGDTSPISAQGAWLGPASRWYPRFGNEQLSFEISLRLPPDWHGLTQGSRLSREADPAGVSEVWRETRPQEAIWLAAGPYHEYVGETQPALAMALLRQPEPELAWRYLDVTTYYLDFYSQLLGAYPYDKFALVENRWESGYGLPSFTLLGSRVIRLPFILHTSYPHEILHNWWGNGVYPDPGDGNWSEGLTAYLADHLLAQQEGRGRLYRRNALQRYTDYVRRHRAFPLRAFQGRHDEITQSVGYDQGLMLFHMLRVQLGDDTFLAGLRRFFEQYRFRRAGYADLRAVMEETSQTDLTVFFRQWLDRPGAPGLALSDLRADVRKDGWRLHGVLRQTQTEPAYHLAVPLAIQLDGRETAYETTLDMADKRLDWSLDLPARPWRVTADPRFEVMRRLQPEESPPALSSLFGAESPLIVVPAGAPPALRRAYGLLARQWATESGARVAVDSELERLPADRSIWLLGTENRFRDRFAQTLARPAVDWRENGVGLEDEFFPYEDHALVLAARHPHTPAHALGWLSLPVHLADGEPAPILRLAAKLRHYGRYGALAFTGPDMDRAYRRQWPVTDSPLTVPVIQPDGAPAPARRADLPSRPGLGSDLP